MPLNRDENDDHSLSVPHLGALLAGAVFPVQMLLLVLQAAGGGDTVPLAFYVPSSLYLLAALVGGGLVGYAAHDGGPKLSRRFTLHTITAGGWYALTTAIALAIGAVGVGAVDTVVTLPTANPWLLLSQHSAQAATMYVVAALLGGVFSAEVGPSRDDSLDQPGVPEDVDEATAEALRRLRKRYAAGDIDQPELERRTEALLARAMDQPGTEGDSVSVRHGDDHTATTTECSGSETPPGDQPKDQPDHPSKDIDDPTNTPSTDRALDRE